MGNSYSSKKYWHGFDLPRHRFHYSRGGITKLLKDHGFRDVTVIGEAVPSDLIRSLRYYCQNEADWLSQAYKLYLFFPDVIRQILAQLLAILLKPLKSGRLIVLAKTNEN